MRKIDKNYNLFSSYAWYSPGVGGMFALLGWLLLGMLLGSMVVMIIQLISPEFATKYGILISYPLQFMPVMIFASVKSRSRAIMDEPKPLDNRNFGSYSFGLLAVTVVVATLAVAVIMDIIGYGVYRLTLLSKPLTNFYNSVMEVMKNMTGGPVWVSLLSVAIMAPFFEEWLCRGEVLRGLLQKMRPGWAILISALFFAAIHGNPWQAVVAILVGLFMGYIYYKTGSLWLTMIIHCANNSLSVIMSNIDSLKDVDYLYEIVPAAPYWIAFALSVVIVAIVLWMFSRIPALPTSTIEKPEGTTP